MGKSYQGDVPGNMYFHAHDYASLASNGTDRVLPFLGGAGHELEVLSGWFVPHASQVGSASHHADVKVVEITPGGSVVRTLANYALSAAGQGGDANVAKAMALASVVSKAASNLFAVSHEQVSNGIDLVAHTVQVAYRYR